jgi:hypothetical protein
MARLAALPFLAAGFNSFTDRGGWIAVLFLPGCAVFSLCFSAVLGSALGVGFWCGFERFCPPERWSKSAAHQAEADG